MEELPLYLFTLLTQLSAGVALFVAVWVACVGSKAAVGDSENGFANASRSAVMALGVAAVAAAIGVAASLFHLGNPLRALNVLAGLGHSWLSREVVIASVFLVLLIASLVCEKLGKAARPVLWVTTVVGVLMVVVEALAYAATPIPAWGALGTVLSFLAALLVFAATAGPLLLLPNVRAAEAGARVRAVLGGFAGIALLVLVVSLIVDQATFAGLRTEPGAAGMAATAFLGSGGLWLAYAVLSCAALVVQLCLVLRFKRDKDGKSLPAFALCAGSLAAVGLFAGRAVFYLVGLPMGIGL